MKSALANDVPGDPQEIGEPEGLGKPLTPAFLEEAFGVGSGDVIRNEHHPLGQPWCRFQDRSVKRRPVHSGHLEIAYQEVVDLCADPFKRLHTVARSVDLEPGVGQCLRHGDR